MWKLKRWKRKLKKIRKNKNLSDKEINKMLKLYTKINLYEIEQMRKIKEVLSDEDIRDKGRKRRSNSKSKCKGKRRLRKDRSVFWKKLINDKL